MIIEIDPPNIQPKTLVKLEQYLTNRGISFRYEIIPQIIGRKIKWLYELKEEEAKKILDYKQ